MSSENTVATFNVQYHPHALNKYIILIFISTKFAAIPARARREIRHDNLPVCLVHLIGVALDPGCCRNELLFLFD